MSKWFFSKTTTSSPNGRGQGQQGDKIQAAGVASWGGAVVGGEQVIHTGELGGELNINGIHARLTMGDPEFDCSADFSIIGQYLVVADNRNCGGANVSFNGVYSRVK